MDTSLFDRIAQDGPSLGFPQAGAAAEGCLHTSREPVRRVTALPAGLRPSGAW